MNRAAALWEGYQRMLVKQRRTPWFESPALIYVGNFFVLLAFMSALYVFAVFASAVMVPG